MSQIDRSPTDPVRRAVDKVATSDSDREVRLRRVTVRAELPLPRDKRASIEVTHDSARISGKRPGGAR